MKKLLTITFVCILLVSISTVIISIIVITSFFIKSDIEANKSVFEILGLIIAALGAYFVFHSFQAQLNANKIQIDALKEERIRFQADKDYDRILTLITELNNSTNKLSIGFITVTSSNEILGTLAISEYLNYLISNINTREKFNIYHSETFYYSVDRIFNLLPMIANQLLKLNNLDSEARKYLFYKFTFEIDPYISDLEDLYLMDVNKEHNNYYKIKKATEVYSQIRLICRKYNTGNI